MFSPTCRILALGILALAASTALAEPVQLVPVEAVLVLRNGNVLEGRISRAGSRYYVTLPEGEIQVPAEEVELLCRDLDDAYRQKLASVGKSGAEGHLRLARWCLKHRLLGYAAREVAQAERIEPTHPLIRVIEQRLQLAAQPPKRVSRPKPQSHSEAELNSLEQMVRQMPTGTVETFTRNVHPLLMNSCATSSCHLPTGATRDKKKQLVLERISATRTGNRRETLRNLRSVLEWIDREHPAQSRLLVAPIRPHGTAQKAIYSDRTLGQYQKLVDWVEQVSQHDAVVETKGTEKEPLTLFDSVVDEDAFLPIRRTRQPSAPPAPLATERRLADLLRDMAEAKHEDKRALRQASHEEPAADDSSTDDPFDPQIFNRQYSTPERDESKQ